MQLFLDPNAKKYAAQEKPFQPTSKMLVGVQGRQTSVYFSFSIWIGVSPPLCGRR